LLLSSWPYGQALSRGSKSPAESTTHSHSRLSIRDGDHRGHDHDHDHDHHHHHGPDELGLANLLQ
jgi:hypothetical protein